MPRVNDGSTGSLFDSSAEAAERATAPLAVRMRPRTLAEVIGQTHLTRDGSPLRKLADTDSPMSVLLWGPPGTGKTTLAYVVANVTKRRFVELSAVSAGVKDVRAAIETARGTLGMTGEQTVLFIDEVHRFNKAQQDALLPAVENRWVSFIGATTENPSFSVVGPLLSRSLLLTLRPLDDEDIRLVISRALADERGLAGRIKLADGVTDQLVRLAGGDARRVLTYLEAAALGLPDGGEVTLELLERAVDRAMVRYDRAGDQHYDVISAFIKSMRGSDADAALHYLARMIEAGEDPRFIARRLIVHASEDVGMADPTALQTAVAAAQAVEFVGLPEARLNLAQAVIHIALAPKSNAVAKAIWDAGADIQQGLAGAGSEASAGRELPRCREARARQGLPVRARRPGRRRAAAVRAGQPGRQAVLRADQLTARRRVTPRGLSGSGRFCTAMRTRPKDQGGHGLRHALAAIRIRTPASGGERAEAPAGGGTEQPG